MEQKTNSVHHSTQYFWTKQRSAGSCSKSHTSSRGVRTYNQDSDYQSELARPLTTMVFIRSHCFLAKRLKEVQKSWWDWNKLGILIKCWSEYKWHSHSRKQFGKYASALKIFIPFILLIPILGIYTKEIIRNVNKTKCVGFFFK